MGSVFSTPVSDTLPEPLLPASLDELRRRSGDGVDAVPAPSPVDAFPPRWFRPLPEFVGLSALLALLAADDSTPPARWSLLSTKLGPTISRHDYYGDPFSPPRRLTMSVLDYEALIKEKERRVPPEPAMIMRELDRIMVSIHEEMDYFGWRLPPYMIVAFVDAMQEAIQYFKLGSFLRDKEIASKPLLERKDATEESLLEAIVMQLKVMEDFNMIDKMAILHSIKEHKSNLISAQEVNQNIKYLTHLVYSTIDWKTSFSAKDCHLLEEFPYFEERILEEGFQWCRSTMILFGSSEEQKKSCLRNMIDKIQEDHSIRMKKNKENDKLVAERPVYDLVFRVFEQQEAYVMDKDPAVEIQKSMLYDGWFSHHFMKDAPMMSLLYQARSVAVSKVPLNASSEDIKQLFPIWEIEHIQMEMESKQTSQIVFVVFKDLLGIEGAITLQGLAVHDVPIIIKPCLGYHQRQALAKYLKSESAGILSSNMEIAKFNQAIEKYQWLTGAYLESRKESKLSKPFVEH